MAEEADGESVTCTITLRPPAYPEKLFPFRCTHDPQFGMSASTRLTSEASGGRKIEVDHAVCLACGLPRPCTFGGNILVDLCMIAESEAGAHRKIGQRALHLRDRWAQVAFHLFDDEGWNGRHERVARSIDPKLNMKLFCDAVGGDGSDRMMRVVVDPLYLRIHSGDAAR